MKSITFAFVESGFAARNNTNGVCVLAYRTSQNHKQALRDPRRIASEMIAGADAEMSDIAISYYNRISAQINAGKSFTIDEART